MTKDYFIYGKHTVLRAIKAKKRSIQKIFCTEKTRHLVEDQAPAFESLSKDAFERLLQKLGLNKVLHQDIIAKTNRIAQPSFDELMEKEPQLLIALDEMQDSQNIGTIIRRARLFGWDALIAPLHRSPEENPQILKAASGAFEETPYVKVVNLAQTLDELKRNGFWIVGLSSRAKESLIEQAKIVSNNKKLVLVMGAEAKGIRPLVERACDFLFKIPINNLDGLDSLNVASAAAIGLYELSRSRQQT